MFCEFQIHYFPIGYKGKKPRILSREGGASHCLVFGEPLNAGAFLRNRKLRAISQWIREQEKPLSSWKWQLEKAKVASGSLSSEDEREKGLAEAVTCVTAFTGLNCGPTFLPADSCPCSSWYGRGLRKPFPWPLESSIWLQPRGRCAWDFWIHFPTDGLFCSKVRFHNN